MGILILGVFIHATSWKAAVAPVLQQQGKQEQQCRQQVTSSTYLSSGMVRLRILAWTVLVGAILIITTNVLSLVIVANNKNDDDHDKHDESSDIVPPPLPQLNYVGWWIYSIAILLFVIHAAMIWYHHAQIAISATTRRRSTIHKAAVSASQGIVVLQVLYGLDRLVWQVLLIVAVSTRRRFLFNNPTTTAYNVHNANLYCGLFTTTILIHNVLLSLFQQHHQPALGVSTVGP
jgi:hypothetical protein